MKNIEMDKRDIKTVIEAAGILDQMNRKYGCPHGDNPIGIVIAAYKCSKKNSSRPSNNR